MNNVIGDVGALIVWSGGLLILGGLVLLSLALMGVRNRAVARREARARVRRAAEDAARSSVGLLLPNQRDGEQ